MLNERKTYDDYFKDRNKKNNNIQSKPNPTSRMFERNTSGVLATNTDYGNSNYDKKLNWGADVNLNDIKGSLNENRSEQQGGWAEAGAFGGRVINKVGLEVAKTAGAIVGTVGGLAGNTVDLLTGEDNTDFLQTAFNNDFIKAAEKISKSINKEYLPVYVSDTVTNGSFLDKVTSGEFWATEGADGVGYLISAMAPGAAFKALGGANKLFGGATKVAKFLNFEKGLEGSRTVMKAAGMTIDKINDYAIPAINTYFEAGAEAKGVSDDLDARKPEFLANYQNQQLKNLQELDIRRRKGEINVDEYNKLSEDIGNKTAENAFLEQKSKAMRNTFLTNIGILAIPNYIQAKLVFGKNPSNILLDKITGKIADKTIKNTIKQAGKRIGQSFLSEGSEEIAQTSTEKRNVDKAIKGELSNTYVQDINPLTFGKDFVKSLGTTEGQVAGFLGGMLGSPISIVQGYRQDNADKTRTEKLRTKINGSSSALQDIYNTPLYETEEYTNPETSQVGVRDKEVNGKKVFIPENVAKVKNALDFQEQLSKIYDKAVEEGDTQTLEHLKKQGEFNIIANYIGEDVVTLDALNEHLKVIFPTTENNEDGSVLTQEQVKKNTENKERITNVVDKARVLQKDLVSFKDMSSSIIKLKNPEASKEQIIDFLNNLGNAFISERSEEYDLKQKYKELKLKQQEFKKDQTIENIENVDFIQGKTEDIYKEKKIINNPRLDFINKQIKQVEEELQNFNETTNALIWDNEFLNKQLNNKIQASKKLKEATSEEKVQETDNIITNIKSATTIEDLDNIKPNEYTAEQFNEKRGELESYKTGERESEVAEKTVDTNVRQVLKSELEELTDDMTLEKYYTFKGQSLEFVNKDVNGNLLYETQNNEQILFVDKITKQEETTIDDIVAGSANDFKVIDPKIVSDGTVKDDGKSPGSIKNNKQYADYLLESRDKTGDTVTFSINTSNFVKDKDSLAAIKLYDKLLKDEKFSATNEELDYLIKHLPIQFNYNNNSTSFSSHGNNLNSKLRISIINALQSGIKLENIQSVITNQANANFNNQIVDGKPAVNNVLNIVEFDNDVKNLVLYHINTEGKFIVVSEKQEDFQGSHKVNQDLSGNIFVVMSHPKGYKVPVKLNSNKLNITQAEGLALLYKELTKSENTAQRDQVLANLESFNKIKDLLSKEIQLLGNNSNKISIDEMIKLLVLENSSKDSNKSIEIGIDENSNQIVRFNNSEYNLENDIEDFVKDLTENKKQNVITIETDVTKIGNKEITFKNQAYLKYLFNNKIVSTDINTNPEEGSFKTASSNTEQGSEVYIRSAVESNKPTTNAVFSGKQSFTNKIQGKLDLTGVETSTKSEVEAKKAEIEKKINNLPDNLLFITHITSEGNAEIIFNNNLLMPAGVSSTTGIVSKEKLKQLLFDLAENKSPHRGYLDLFVGAIDKVTLESTNGKSLQDKLENYLDNNFINDVSKTQFPSDLNIGYFTKGVLNTKYDVKSNTLENNSENIRNNKNNSVSLPNNVKIENEMDIPNTQANLDYKEAIDKIIIKGNMTVDLQEMIDSLEKANNSLNNVNFKGMPEFMQNVTLKNIEKLNKQINETVEKLNKKC